MSNPSLVPQPTFYDLLFKFLDLDDPTVGGAVTKDLIDVQGVNLAQVAGQTARVRTTSAATDTLVLADVGKTVETTHATGCTVTVPANSTVAYPVGTVIYLQQCGAGAITFVGAGGVTVNAVGGDLIAEGQWQGFKLRKRATDTWVLNRLQ